MAAICAASDAASVDVLLFAALRAVSVDELNMLSEELNAPRKFGDEGSASSAGACDGCA